MNLALIAAFILAVLRRQIQEHNSLLYQVAANLPMLAFFCVVGLLAAAIVSWRDDAAPIPYAALAAGALAFAFVGEYVDVLAHTPQYQKTLLWDVVPKLVDYWCPYFLVFPAGFVVALAYDRWSRPAVFFVLMALLIYPWRLIKEPIYYDSAEHSISEHSAFNLHQAAEGYWIIAPIALDVGRGRVGVHPDLPVERK